MLVPCSVNMAAGEKSGASLRSSLLLHEWSLNSHFLDFHPFLVLVIKHSGQEMLPFINIMIVAAAAVVAATAFDGGFTKRR